MTTTLTRNPRTIAEERRNRAKNPSVGKDLTGWEAVGGGGAGTALSRNTGVGAPVATTAATCTLTTAAATYWLIRYTVDLDENLAAGTEVAASGYAYSSQSGRTTRAELDFLDITGAVLSHLEATPTAHATGAWERRSVTGLAPAGTRKLRLSLVTTNGGASGQFMRGTGVLFETDTLVIGDFFAGYTADAPPIYYDWVGLADDSESIAGPLNPADIITPIQVNGYASQSEARSTAHQIAMSSQVVVSIIPAGPRTGRLELLFDDVTEARSAEAAFRQGGLFDFADTDLPELNMKFVPAGGGIETGQDDTRIAWLVTIPFVEVT